MNVNEAYEQVSNIIDREDFDKRIQEKMETLGDLGNEETAAMLVMSDLGVDDGNMELIELKDVSQSSGNVMVRVKVLKVSDKKEFNRNDGTIGRVANVLVGDTSGQCKVTLWDEKAELVDNGTISDAMNLEIIGYTKEGRDGNVEINVGDRGSIKEIDENVSFVPSITSISDIKEGMSNINIKGIISGASKTRTFNRKDGTEGKVRNVTVNDGSDAIRLTLWDEQTDLVDSIGIGNGISVIGATAKFDNYTNKVGLQMKRDTQVSPINDVEVEEEFSPISELSIGEDGVNLHVNLVAMNDIKEFNGKRGPGKLMTVSFGDAQHNKISGIMWNDDVDTFVDKFKEGDSLELRNVKVQENKYSNEKEILIKGDTNIKKSDTQIKYEEPLTNIDDIMPDGSYSIAGEVIEVSDDVHEFEKSNGQTSRVSNINIMDGTGSIKVSLWDKKADMIDHIEIGDRVCVIDGYSTIGYDDELEIRASVRSSVKKE
jgi:replication factor A1